VTDIFPSSVLSSSIDADQFLGAGGYCLYIRQPSQITLSPYIEQLTTLTSQNTNPELTLNYAALSYALTEVTKPQYPNPQLFLSFDVNDNPCGVIFYYEVEDNGIFCWIESWASIVKGAGDLSMHFLGTYAAQRSYDLYGNATSSDSSDYVQNVQTRPFISKDSITKWYYVPSSSVFQLGRSQIQYASSLEYFFQIYDELPPGDNPVEYDFNNNIWVDTVVDPQSDYGTPPEYEIDKFYKLNTETKAWILN